MKLHTLNREYCFCKRHPRKFKKRITIMNKKFIKAMDELTQETEVLGLYNYHKEKNE